MGEVGDLVGDCDLGGDIGEGGVLGGDMRGGGDLGGDIGGGGEGGVMILSSGAFLTGKSSTVSSHSLPFCDKYYLLPHFLEKQFC